MRGRARLSQSTLSVLGPLLAARKLQGDEQRVPRPRLLAWPGLTAAGSLYCVPINRIFELVGWLSDGGGEGLGGASHLHLGTCSPEAALAIGIKSSCTGTPKAIAKRSTLSKEIFRARRSTWAINVL